MAADNSKNSSSAAKDTEPAVKTGGDDSLRRDLSAYLSKKNIISGLLVIVIIAVAIGLVTGKLHLGPKVYAQVAGHKIYKKDVQNLKADNKSVSDHDAATVLADKYLSQAMAREQKVTVSQADIAAAGCSGQKTNPYGYQTCANQVYFAKLANDNAGVYEGKYLMASFSRYVPYQSPLLAEQQKANPKLGDPAAIAADKAYAQTFITNLYDQIKAGKISFDQAIQAEHNDPTIGQASKIYKNQPHSGDFDGPLNQYNAFSAPGLKQKIADMKPGEITKPFVVRVADSATDPSSTAESYFLVVRLDKASGGHSKVDFPQALQQAKKRMGYKVNV